ncbi:MAG TPA: glycosyltransferase [Gemmatimonadota bacterium]|nr:glycosyltransferase [Gemmatimonadota bacterium]
MTGAGSRVSVVLAVPIGGEWVGRALESVLRNRGPAFDVWIAASTASDSRQSLGPFADDARVRILRVPARASAALHNEAIARASGDVLAITDDDCEVAENWIAEMVQAFDRDPRIGMVFGSVHPAPAARGDLVVPSYVRTAEFMARDPREKSRVEGVWACMGVRRETWAALGGFDQRFGRGSRFPGCSDSDLALRALAAGWFVLETPKVSVTIHRALAPEEHRETIVAYTYASGALIGKHLRGRTSGILNLMSDLARRWAGGGSHTAVGLGSSTQRPRRLLAFVRGFARGLTVRTGSEPD